MTGTAERIVISRDGGERRPRSGIQEFPMADVTRIHVELGTGDSGRIAVWVADQEAVSMFFDARSIDRAYDAVDIVRPLLARRRRASRRGEGLDNDDLPATRRSGRETIR